MAKNIRCCSLGLTLTLTLIQSIQTSSQILLLSRGFKLCTDLNDLTILRSISHNHNFVQSRDCFESLGGSSGTGVKALRVKERGVLLTKDDCQPA